MRFVAIPPLLLAGLILSLGLSTYPLTQSASAHTFSATESALFLSLVEQLRAEATLVVTNLQNNNVTLAQAHASKISELLDNSTLDEIRERNDRIADALTTTITQLEGNVTSLASSERPVPQNAIHQANLTIMTLNDTLDEASTVRIESDQRSNATAWASVLADIANVILSEYGNATGAPFDLTNMSNMANNGSMAMDHDNMSMTDNTMKSNTTSGNATTIVDMAAYQSAQYLANNTTFQLFNNKLRPLTSGDNATNLDRLEMGLIQLRDGVNDQASPTDIMKAVHVDIHPLLIEIYGLIVAPEDGSMTHSDMSH
jgi:hypothetical protein